MYRIILILSLLNASLIFCLQKWGWFQWYETRKPKWLLWVKQCFFCFGFRLAAIEVILLAISQHCYTWEWLYVPLCCAALTYLIVINLVIGSANESR